MIKGHFYFIKDEFYNALTDCGLMANKEQDSLHGRPCNYCFPLDGYMWMIPISSRVDKYRKIYNDKLKKRGYCDGIRFGYINGRERAFLLQNIFPVTERYIDCEYMINHGQTSVVVSESLSRELNALARAMIRRYKDGRNGAFTDIARVIEFLEANN